MSQELLIAAIEQAERSEPAVRAAALLHAARVLATWDQAAAEHMLEKGIALAQELPDNARTAILGNAVSLAAAVSPKHALPLYATFRRKDPFGGAVVGLVNAMAQHGHIGDAITYLNDPLPGDRFPLHFVTNLAGECRDDETRLKLLQAAIRSWREHPPDAAGHEPFAGPSFVGFFARSGHLLPREEASQVLTEIVEWTRKAPAETRRMLPSRQELEAQLGHPAPALGRRTKADISEDAMMIGSCFGSDDDPPNSQVIYMREAIGNDFRAAFDEAFSRYAHDSDAENPNEAPKECWPSTHEFRNILFKAGQHLGLAAMKYLNRIPDADLRLLAQIDLCAAIAGLPQIGGITIVYPRRRARPSIRAAAVLDPATNESTEGSSGQDPGGVGIRCPKCGWKPRAEDCWCCDCGHRWNTFDTGGVCPGCQHQWKTTQCPQCGEWSPHSEWYAQG